MCIYGIWKSTPRERLCALITENCLRVMYREGSIWNLLIVREWHDSQISVLFLLIFKKVYHPTFAYFKANYEERNETIIRYKFDRCDNFEVMVRS